ncbi:hypothetical protein EVA_04160 [gut metagenome]|uniref:Uncharacterized protein n=1 Tax=gut metagenome TaxID=749906 RepID=J9H2G6_9ZZZZ
MQAAVVNRVDAIEPQPEAHHVEVAFGETLDAGRIADVAQQLVGEGLLQLPRSSVKEFELAGREGIEVRTVTPHEMREDRTRDDGRLMVETVDEHRQVGLRIETEAVHTRVEFDVYGETLYAFFLSGTDQRLQQSETVDLRFEVVFKQSIESRNLRIHDQNARRDPRTTQFRPFVGHRHSEIVDATVLQGTRNLHTAGTIGRSLDHAHHLRFGLHEGTVVFHIVRQGFQIHLQSRFVHPQRKLCRDLLDVEVAAALQQHRLVVELFEETALQQVRRMEEEMAFHREIGTGGRESRTDGNQTRHPSALQHLCHLAVERIRLHPTLQDVTEDKCLARLPIALHRFRELGSQLSAVHEVEGDVERSHIRIVAVVDQGTAPYSLFHLQAHRHRFEARHPFHQSFQRQLAVEPHRQGMDAVFQ